MDLKTKDSFDFKSERRSGKLFKRIISGITAAAMAAGLLTTSAFADEEVTYEHTSDINSVVDIMKNYAFIGFNEVDMNGHQHINLLVNKVVGLPGDMGIRKSYAGVYEYYVNKLPDDISGELKIGENDPCVSNLTLGSDYTISTNGSERYIEPNHVKVSPSVTNIKAETATNKYIDLVNLQNSFISYSAMLAENADSTEGFGFNGQYDNSSHTWQNINRINVTAESGTVFYNIDDTNFSKINNDAIINFSDTSTASIVLNIDLKNISWDRKPFRLNIGGSQPTMNEDVILEDNVNRIYYNFYDSSAADKMTTKTVSMTDAAHGTIIIPKGTAKVGSNWCGVIVANNIGATGESHFVGAYNPVVPTSATVDVTVNKVWSEPSGQSHDGYYVKVDLMRSSAAETAQAIDNAILDSSNNFEYTFTGLKEKDADGNTYTYTVANEVTDAPEYIDGVQSGYEVSYSGTTVTNTWKEATIPAPKTDITVNKVWAGDSGKNDHSGYTITVDLMRKVGSGAGEFVQEVILTSANSFTKTINDIDAEDADGNAYTYYVANESGAPEYIDGVQSGYEVSYNGTTVTNTWKEATIPAPKTDITVNKVWAGEPSSQSHDSYYVKVDLMRSSAAEPARAIDTATLDASNNFEYTFTGLDEQDANGNPYTYTVANEITDAPKYTENVQSGYEVSYNGTTVTNTWKKATIPAPKTDITVNKVWAG
ncbi:Cna B-type domain-containing protein, partial [Huintestinicola butyrica]|uniref:Cna B-type domain-containing protein n=1 Tax=Huintestinicola butyrica TaxID=2981728 RepID=UPI003F7D5F74